MNRSRKLSATALVAVALVLNAAQSVALEEVPAAGEKSRPIPMLVTQPAGDGPLHGPWALQARDTVDVESHGGYTSEYIFGMSKGVMRSTLVPALKPVVLLLTVPLDIVFLPFAAIGGFFR